MVVLEAFWLIICDPNELLFNRMVTALVLSGFCAGICVSIGLMGMYIYGCFENLYYYIKEIRHHGC